MNELQTMVVDTPGATLLDLGRLFSDESYRRAAVANLSDGFLRESWAQYESLSPGARIEVRKGELPVLLARVHDLGGAPAGGEFTDRLVAKFDLPVAGWRGRTGRSGR